MRLMMDMVLHQDYEACAFTLTDAIVDLLRDRGCAWVDQCVRSDNAPKAQDGGLCWYVPHGLLEAGNFRCDPVFVEVVRELTERYDRECEELESWKDRARLERRLLNGLRVLPITIEVEIEENAGMEVVRVRGGYWGTKVTRKSWVLRFGNENVTAVPASKN